MSHANISVFVPFVGCPNRCSFCDQRSITGETKAPGAEDVKKAVETAAATDGYDGNSTELAFFGGSFTAIDREYMKELLEAAYIFVQNKTIKGIRISTRPDCVDREVLPILKNYGVTAIELGTQSLCDDVLEHNRRGHTAADVVNACQLIKEFGFELGLQMMTGLYGSDLEKDRYTARKIIELKPDTVRIYPTVTLKNTLLEKLFLSGDYIPPTLEETIGLCAELKSDFEGNGIKVIRLGLHSIDKDSYVAGPWHPAFGELCESAVMYKKALKILNEKGNYLLSVNTKDVSKMIGQKRKNIEKLKFSGYICRVVADDGVLPGEVAVRKDEEICI